MASRVPRGANVTIAKWAREHWLLLTTSSAGAIGFGWLLSSASSAAFVVPPGPRRVADGGPVAVDPPAPIVVERGHTYFAAVITHHGANAATVAAVKARAEKEGFRDVVVSPDVRPSHWPGTVAGADYYVRGTYAGSAARAFPRVAGNFLGSVDVLDVWAA